MGIRGWNPAQVVNNLPAIKKKHLGKLSLAGCWDSQGKFSNPNVSTEILREELEKYVSTFAPGGGFVYMAMIGGKPDNPNVKERMDIIKDYYNTNVRDYYKTH